MVYRVVRSLSMANYLVRQGFDIIKVDDCKENKQLKIFLFQDSHDLRNAMSSFSSKIIK